MTIVWEPRRLAGMLRRYGIGVLAGLLIATIAGCGAHETSEPVEPPSATPTAVKISCVNRGVYRISGEELAAHGFALATLDPARLSLVSSDGPEPIYVEGGADGQFDPQDALYFFSKGILDSDLPYLNLIEDFYDASVSYILYPDDTRFAARRYEPFAMQTPAEASAEYPVVEARRRLHFEDNPIWKFFTDTNRALQFTDYLFWTELTIPETNESKSVFETSFSLPHADLQSTAVLRLQLVGVAQDSRFASNTLHRVELSLNGRFTRTLEWPMGQRVMREIELPPDAIAQEINNLSLTLTAPGSVEAPEGIATPDRIMLDDVLLDWIEIDFTQKTRLYNNYNEFIFDPALQTGLPSRFSIHDFLGDGVMLFDLDHQTILQGTPYEEDPAQFLYAINVQMPEGVTSSTRLLALEKHACLTADGLEAIDQTHYFETASDAQLLVLSHPDFLDDLKPFVEWKKSRGLKVELVNIIDLFNEKSAGAAGPETLRAYVRHVYDSQSSPTLKYLLLVGDSTTISKYKAYVPTYSYLQSGSHANDNYFANFESEEEAPILAVGRFSVRTSEQLKNIINKVIAYEKGETDAVWRRNIFLIAASQVWAERDADMLIEKYFSPDYGIRLLKTDRQNSDPSYFDVINQRMMDYMNQGSLMTIFFGHGGGTVWEIGPSFSHADFRRHLFNQENVIKMTNTTGWPLVFALTCYTNDFDNPFVGQTLGETFVNASNGAIGVIGAADRSFVSHNFSYMNKFLTLLKSHAYPRLGDYFAEAKRLLKQPLMNTNYNLLGDPSLEFSLPRIEIALSQPGLTANGKLTFHYQLPADLALPARLDFSLFDQSYVEMEQWQSEVAQAEGELAYTLKDLPGTGTLRLVTYTRGAAAQDYAGGVEVLPGSQPAAQTPPAEPEG